MLVWLAFESVIPAVVVVVVVASIVATVVATVVVVVVVADVSIMGGTEGEGVPNSVDIAFTSPPLPNVLRFVSFNLSRTEGLGLYIHNKTGRTIIRAKRYTLIGSVCI